MRHYEPDSSLLDRLIWLTIAGGYILAAAISFAAGFSVTLFQLGIVAAASILLLAIALVYERYRDGPALAVGATMAAQLILFMPSAAICSYAVVIGDRPLWDERLAAFDVALGLDWMAYFRFVVSTPVLHWAMKTTYGSTLPAVIVAGMILIGTRRYEEMRIFLLAMMGTALICALLPGFMPALNTYMHFGLSPADHPGISLPATTNHIPHLLALRAHQLPVLDLSKAEGIVTFPSFHAALGVLILLALWRVPRVRWGALLFSAIMIAGTPVEGSHYFADILGGALIAAAVYGAVLQVSRRAAAPRLALARQGA